MAFLRMGVHLVAHRHSKVVAGSLVLHLVVVASLALLVAIQGWLVEMTQHVVHVLPVGAPEVPSRKVAHAWALALVAFLQAHALPQGVASKALLTLKVRGFLELLLDGVHPS